MKAKTYFKDQIVNIHGIKYIKDEAPHIESPSGRKRRACTFECVCGNHFVSRLGDVLNNKRTSCGCKKGTHAKQYTSGEKINGVEFIKSLGVKKYIHYALFKCPTCGRPWKSSVGNIQCSNSKSCCSKRRGWSRSQWIKFCNNATLYKVRLYNENESFIKIGITTRSIEHRMKQIPYNYEILKTIEGKSDYIFDLENRYKRLYKENSYSPNIHFLGRTECFKF